VFTRGCEAHILDTGTGDVNTLDLRLVGDRLDERARLVDPVDALTAIGAQLVVSPNCNPAVIRRSVEHGMVSLPGVLTPTEMFAAIEAGASGLKLFPADMAGPAVIKAVRAVLPPAVPILAVGGISAANMGDYLAAGAAGFGIGGALFMPGKPLDAIAADARAIVAAYKAARAV
jgi:2-dehydro-3-deoxyphosphogalactonate aldolase